MDVQPGTGGRSGLCTGIFGEGTKEYKLIYCPNTIKQNCLLYRLKIIENLHIVTFLINQRLRTLRPVKCFLSIYTKISVYPKNSFVTARWGQLFFGDFSMEYFITLPPNSYKSFHDLWKLHCKEEPYRFGGQRDPSVQTNILLLYIFPEVCRTAPLNVCFPISKNTRMVNCNNDKPLTQGRQAFNFC